MAFVGINYLAVLVAAVAAWVLGAVWYQVLSKQWLAAQGRTKADLTGPDGKPKSYAPFVLVFVAELIMAWMLAGILGHLGTLTVKDGVISGAACWLGFVVTTLAANNAFGGRKIMLTVIDAGHWFVVLIVMGAIIGAFGVR
ncbi:MAG TPA: DUF1761 domain-containing protein [Xanthobacteraceae bacterium]|nr:DUF1761 domain-containing protein [Xanthobacteraceae bacterium]